MKVGVTLSRSGNRLTTCSMQMADFGLDRLETEPRSQRTYAGTAPYMSPVFYPCPSSVDGTNYFVGNSSCSESHTSQRHYDLNAADIWSIGATMANLMNGERS
jgi:serine/threonine protein kinase